MDPTHIVEAFVREQMPSFEILDDGVWAYTEDGDLCPIRYVYAVKEEKENFLYYICPQIEVFKDDVMNVMEFITRANAGLRIGNFELYIARGEIRFKSSLCYTGFELTHAMVRAAVEPANTAFNRYFGGIANVIAGSHTPIRALNEIDYR